MQFPVATGGLERHVNDGKLASINRVVVLSADSVNVVHDDGADSGVEALEACRSIAVQLILGTHRTIMTAGPRLSNQDLICCKALRQNGESEDVGRERGRRALGGK